MRLLLRPAAALTLLLTLAAPAAEPRVTKEALLKNIAAQVIVPAHADLAARTRELAAATDALAANATAETLTAARQSCAAALLAWKRVSCIQHGPVEELDLLNKFGFWPSRPNSIQGALDAERAMDDAFIAEQGVTVVSLSALEYLLFSSGSPSSIAARMDVAESLKTFTGEAGARRRALTRAVARQLAAWAAQLDRAWSPTGGNHAAKWTAAGQASVGLLVNNFVAVLERSAVVRIDSVLELAGAPQDVHWFEGAPSGHTVSNLVAVVTTVRRLYAGGDGAGFDDQLRQMGSPLPARLDAQFDRTLAALNAIGGPMEVALRQNKPALEAARDQCRALEVLLKVDLVSALGVTLTFTSGDGD